MIDIQALSEAVDQHGAVVRIVIGALTGSAPRGPGVSMLVWADGISGTIGGGAHEFDAIKIARNMLDRQEPLQVQQQMLGTDHKQFCGGVMTLVFERFDATRLKDSFPNSDRPGAYLRKVQAGASTPPTILLRHWETQKLTPTILRDGWLIEPTRAPRRRIMIYGAGNVGHTLARVLAPLPQFEVYLADVREDQFRDLPRTVHQSWQRLPTDLMAEAPDDAAHFIMTPEHDYDLELCHRLLGRKFGYAGLIGSGVKWARFRDELQSMGHSERSIARIQCPIGDPSLGKEPQAIAIGVAAALLRLEQDQQASVRDTV
ncbi:xanthine dehydrogenase accessory protein XdhC [Roseovarius sp. 2305UL8-3]|uniref:xanthine dehydrogenase accessory protein XdhC n=1 Tax=Roseovarius conchicola TaxID=3121636 RepID=UPI003528F872